MIRRPHLLQAFGAVLAGLAIVERTSAQSVFDWKQRKSPSIEVNHQLSLRGDSVTYEAQHVEVQGTEKIVQQSVNL
jgi:hypothetical protein